jgi:hypothetical protein
LVRKTGVIALAIVAIVAVLWFAPYRSTAILLDPSCRPLEVEGEVRDIRVDERGLAYVATDQTIVLVDLNAAVPRPRAALATQPPDFRPLALSLFENRLFVVDRHEEGRSQVIVFEQTVTGAFAPAGKPVRDALMTAPEAVRATGPNQFYVANEAKWFFQDPTVVYYDGTKMQQVTAATPTRSLNATTGKRVLVGSAPGTDGLRLCGK